MAVAIAFEAEVSERGIADFVKALARYQKETQRDMRGALRSATIDLVKSLRARTRKAPKIVPREDARWGESDPRYVTGKDMQVFITTPNESALLPEIKGKILRISGGSVAEEEENVSSHRE